MEAGQGKADKAKNWLWRYRKAKLDCLGLESEYQAVCATQECAGAVQYTGMPGGSGNISDLSDLMVRREAIMNRLIAKQKEMSNACVEIIGVADRLSGVGRDIILLRYVRLKDGYRVRSFVEIGRELGYSESQIKRYHSEALQKVEKMIPNEPK